jgi:hypothetical protein
LNAKNTAMIVYAMKIDQDITQNTTMKHLIKNDFV